MPVAPDKETLFIVAVSTRLPGLRVSGSRVESDKLAASGGNPEATA